LTQNLYDQKITPQEAESALPIALQNLTYSGTNDPNYPSENLRWRSAALIGALGLQPEVSVPALINAMNNSGDSVAMECANALEKFNSGRAAIPALNRIANSATNEVLRRMAQNTLDRIQKTP
jgi:HEAT repeat protein